MNLRLLLVSSFLAVTSAVVAQGCADPVSVADRPCPCVDGWTCCAGKKVCIAPGETCEVAGSGPDTVVPDAGDAPDASDDTAPRRLAETLWARCLTASGGYVYWQQTDGLVTGLLASGDKGPEVPNSRMIGQLDYCGLAVDDGLLFYTLYVHAPAPTYFGVLNQLDLYAYGSWSLQNAPSTTWRNDLTTPSSVAVTPDAVLYTEFETGRVTLLGRKVVKTVVLATGMNRPGEVRVHGRFAYFVEYGQGEPVPDGSIRRVSLDAPAPAEVETLVGNIVAPRGLQIVDGTLYFAAGRPSGSSGPPDSRVYALPLESSPLVAKPILGDVRFGGRTFVVSGDAIYYPRIAVGDNTPRVVAKAALSTEAEGVDLYTSKDEIVDLAADETRLYWADEVSVWSGPK